MKFWAVELFCIIGTELFSKLSISLKLYAIKGYDLLLISGQYGMPKPWYFFIRKDYWCGQDYSTNDGLANMSSHELSQNTAGMTDT